MAEGVAELITGCLLSWQMVRAPSPCHPRGVPQPDCCTCLMKLRHLLTAVGMPFATRSGAPVSGQDFLAAGSQFRSRNIVVENDSEHKASDV